MVKLALLMKSYASPKGFNRVLIVVPRETLHHELQGGAMISKAPGPVLEAWQSDV